MKGVVCGLLPPGESILQCADMLRVRSDTGPPMVGCAVIAAAHRVVGDYCLQFGVTDSVGWQACFGGIRTGGFAIW